MAHTPVYQSIMIIVSTLTTLYRPLHRSGYCVIVFVNKPTLRYCESVSFVRVTTPLNKLE